MDGPRCRICGLGVHLVDTEIGPVLKHVKLEIEDDHGAVEDDGSYFETLPPPAASR